MAVNRQKKVLSLYRDILRAGRKWEVPEESQYITNEAQDLFRKNRFLKDPAEIDAKIFEAESRMELAFHYRIPYPRMFYAPKNTVTKAKNKDTFVKSAYMHSYYKDSKVKHNQQGDNSTK